MNAVANSRHPLNYYYALRGLASHAFMIRGGWCVCEVWEWAGWGIAVDLTTARAQSDAVYRSTTGFKSCRERMNVLCTSCTRVWPVPHQYPVCPSTPIAPVWVLSVLPSGCWFSCGVVSGSAQVHSRYRLKKESTNRYRHSCHCTYYVTYNISTDQVHVCAVEELVFIVRRSDRRRSNRAAITPPQYETLHFP